MKKPPAHEVVSTPITLHVDNTGDAKRDLLRVGEIRLDLDALRMEFNMRCASRALKPGTGRCSSVSSPTRTSFASRCRKKRNSGSCSWRSMRSPAAPNEMSGSSCWRKRTDQISRCGAGLASVTFASWLADRDGRGFDRLAEVLKRAVLAPFAVDQAASLCSCGHEKVDSVVVSVFRSWTITEKLTIATRRLRQRTGAVKMSFQFMRVLTTPACIADVLVSRPNCSARCGRTKL